jgi:hypothetical protein
VEPLWIPVVLDRLEGTVSRPDVDVSEAAPADDNERTAIWIWPDCGLTTKSRMCPNVLPSCDWTELFMSWLSRTLLPDCMAVLLPRELLLVPRRLELELEPWPKLLEVP